MVGELDSQIRHARKHSMSETSREAKLSPIGVIRSTIKTRAQAPKQGPEGAPDAWLEVNESVREGLDGLRRETNSSLSGFSEKRPVNECP